VSGPSSPNLAISGDVQQLRRPMPEEVRPQYEDAVTKPLDGGAGNERSQPGWGERGEVAETPGAL